MSDKENLASSIAEKARSLPTDEKLDLLRFLCAEIPPDLRREEVLLTVKAMPVEDQKTVAKGAVQALPEPEQRKVANELMAYFPPPDTTTRDKIWMIIIGSFAFVLVAGFLALAAGMFLPASGSKVEPALILSMFMSAVGFIGGLFVPSPASGRGSGTNGG